MLIWKQARLVIVKTVFSTKFFRRGKETKCCRLLYLIKRERYLLQKLPFSSFSLCLVHMLSVVYNLILRPSSYHHFGQWATGCWLFLVTSGPEKDAVKENKFFSEGSRSFALAIPFQTAKQYGKAFKGPTAWSLMSFNICIFICSTSWKPPFLIYVLNMLWVAACVILSFMVSLHGLIMSVFVASCVPFAFAGTLFTKRNYWPLWSTQASALWLWYTLFWWYSPWKRFLSPWFYHYFG